MRKWIGVSLFFIIFWSIAAYALSPALEKSHQVALDYMHAGQYQKALAILKQLLVQDPKAVEIYNDLGTLYAKLGNLKKAIELWQKALSLDPNFLTARYNLVRAYIDQKNYKEAILQLKFITQNFPQEVRAYNILGVIYWLQGNWDEAEVAFKKAITISPSYEAAHFNLAKLYLERAITEYQHLLQIHPNPEIKGEFERILKVNPKSAKAHFLLGQLYQQEGKLDKALAEYRQAANLDKDYGAFFFIHQAQKAQAEGELEKAAQNYEIALRLNPGQKEIYYRLGKIYYLLKQYQKALEVLKKAASFYSNQPYIYHYLGLTYYQLGMYKKAVSAFKKALALKNDYQFHYALGLTYEAMGKYRLARQEYQKVLVLNPQVGAQIRAKLSSLQSSAAKGENKDIDVFLKKWLKSWQERDIKTYARCYSPNFYSNDMDLKAWLRWKKNIFSHRKFIKVKIQRPRITHTESITIVCFQQYYQDDIHADKGEKCLYLEKREGLWQIIREEWHQN